MFARTKLVFLIAALVAGTAMAEEKKPAEPPAAGAPAMDPKKAAEMQKYMEAAAKAGAPGPEHEKLKAMEGTFDAKVSMWMDPKAPPMESTGKSVNKLIFGGRFLMGEYTGDFMGQPFTGMSIIGYDNTKKKYTTLWMESMSTSIATGEGTADKDGTIVVGSSMTDPATGKVHKGTNRFKVTPTGYTMEMWGPPMGGKGKDVKQAEIVYTRK
jgi:hypothetical protein